MPKLILIDYQFYANLVLMSYQIAFAEILAETRNTASNSYLRRKLDYQVLPRKAVILKGIRRCGKSTLLQQIEDDQRKQGYLCLTMNFVDERLAGLSARDLGLIFDAFYQVYPEAKTNHPLCLFFDELQVVEGWESFIDRQLRIKDRRVFITGSSAKLLSREIATSMRGRSLSYEVFPFDFKEFRALQQLEPIALPLGQEATAAVKAQFYTYLMEGGFPETIGIERTTQIQLLQEYFEVLLLRDVIERHNASSPVMVKRFLLQLINRFASAFTINRFVELMRSQGFAVSKTHVSEMLEWFNDAYATFTLTLFSESIHKQNTNAKKLYVIDNGLVNAVTTGRLKNEGRLLENWVFLTLRRRDVDLHYYKTRDGYEVDFYGPICGLVQVSWSLEDEETRKRELRALEQAMEELQIRKALLITSDKSQTIKLSSGTVDVVAAWQWALQQ